MKFPNVTLSGRKEVAAFNAAQRGRLDWLRYLHRHRAPSEPAVAVALRSLEAWWVDFHARGIPLPTAPIPPTEKVRRSNLGLNALRALFDPIVQRGVRAVMGPLVNVAMALPDKGNGDTILPTEWGLITDSLPYGYIHLDGKGADPSGAAYSDAAWTATVADANLKAIVAAGTYKFNAQVTIPKNIALLCAPNTVFNFDGANGAFPDDACVYASGDALVALPALSVTVAVGARTLTFTSAPSVARDDLLVIYDATNGSYHADRIYSRKGEYALVESVSGSVVTLQEPILDRNGYSLPNASLTVYKSPGPTNTVIENLEVTGRGTVGANSTDCVEVKRGRNVVLRNVKARNSNDSNIEINQCYHAELYACDSSMLLADAFGTSYGLTISNSQSIRVFGGEYQGRRHGATIGGGDEIGVVVCRDITFSGSFIGTLENAATSVLAFGGHANTELLTFEGCTIWGLDMSGDLTFVRGCVVHAGTTGEAFHFTELSGLSHTIEGCEVDTGSAPPVDRGVFVDVGGNSIALGPNTRFGGTLRIVNNRWHYNVADGTDPGVNVRNRGATATDLRVIVQGNEFIGKKTANGNRFFFSCDATSGADFAQVVVEGNLGLYWGINIQSALKAFVNGNKVIDGNDYGIQILQGGPGTPTYYEAQGNYVTGCKHAGISIIGKSNAARLARAKVADNVCIDNSRVTTGSSTTDAPVSFQWVEDAWLDGNVLGGTGAAQARLLGASQCGSLYEGSGNTYLGAGSRDYAAFATRVQGARFYGSLVWDPGNLVDGAGETSPDITVADALVGDAVVVAPPYDLQGITATAYVRASGVARIRLQNETGGAIDLASGTWRVRAERIQ